MQFHDREHSGQRFKLGDEALDSMLSFRQLGADDTEAGGYLLGRVTPDRDVLVDFVTVPTPMCERSRHGVFLHGPSHQAYINAAWEASGGHCHYVGHWHTHPEPDPEPSFMDTGEWQEQMRSIPLDCARAFVIIGTEHVRLWVPVVVPEWPKAWHFVRVEVDR